MNDTTGVDLISKTAGSKSFFAIVEYEHKEAAISAEGTARAIPMTILISDSAVKIQNSFTVTSSHSLMTVSKGVGNIRELLMIQAAIHHNVSQNADIPARVANFLRIFILYPNILSSGKEPPTDAGVQL
jgi:hypothetical protein